MFLYLGKKEESLKFILFFRFKINQFCAVIFNIWDWPDIKKSLETLPSSLNMLFQAQCLFRDHCVKLVRNLEQQAPYNSLISGVKMGHVATKGKISSPALLLALQHCIAHHCIFTAYWRIALSIHTLGPSGTLYHGLMVIASQVQVQEMNTQCSCCNHRLPTYSNNLLIIVTWCFSITRPYINIVYPLLQRALFKQFNKYFTFICFIIGWCNTVCYKEHNYWMTWTCHHNKNN